MLSFLKFFVGWLNFYPQWFWDIVSPGGRLVVISGSPFYGFIQKISNRLWEELQLFCVLEISCRSVGQLHGLHTDLHTGMQYPIGEGKSSRQSTSRRMKHHKGYFIIPPVYHPILNCPMRSTVL